MTETRQARLVHLAERDVWERSAAQAVYVPREWQRDGFIHLSRIDQVLTPANRFYRGREDLLALVIDAFYLGDAVVWEAGTDTEELFPHLYAAVPAESVLAEIDFPPGDDGTFVLPPALVRAVRSPLGR